MVLGILPGTWEITLPHTCGPEPDWYWPAFGIVMSVFLLGLCLLDLWDRRRKE